VRIFVWEYVTAGGWREIAAPASVVREGAMMRRALVRDLARIPGVEVVVAVDPGLAPEPLEARAATIAPGDLWGSWRAIAARVDAVWPIAPETGGILEAAARLVDEAGATLLLSAAPALALARSKQATAARLAAVGVPVVATVPLAAAPPAAEAWVVKPDDGIGAVDTLLLADRAALERRRAAAADPGLVVQPYVAGAAMSLSLLAQDGAAWLLACNRQYVAVEGGRFGYRGSLVGGAEHRRAVLEPLAEAIAAAVPELWGYVGVDLVDGAEGPCVLEINPRLTTSYVGLAESCGVNPAALVLALREQSLTSLKRPLVPRAVSVEVPAR